MPDQQRTRGIVNGHWEPTPARSSVAVVRSSVAKLLQKISHAVEPEGGESQVEEQHQPIAAE